MIFSYINGGCISTRPKLQTVVYEVENEKYGYRKTEMRMWVVDTRRPPVFLGVLFFFFLHFSLLVFFAEGAAAGVINLSEGVRLPGCNATEGTDRIRETSCAATHAGRFSPENMANIEKES